MIHKIKIKECFHERIISRSKTFEVRKNDRDYQVGDFLEFIDVDGKIPLRGKCLIIYVHSGIGMWDDYVVLGINLVDF